MSLFIQLYSLFDSNWLLKNFEIPKPNSEQRSFPRSSLKPWIHKWEVLLLPHLLIYSFAFTGKENFREKETYKGNIKCALSLCPLSVLYQVLSPKAILPHGKHLAVSEESLDCHSRGWGTAGMLWAEATDAIKHLQTPTPKARIVQPRCNHC